MTWARDRRTGLAAVLMLLLLLGASLLVSAGSDHHRPEATIAAEPIDTAGVQPDGHHHHHGAEWTPSLGKRLRPASTVSVVQVVPARLVLAGPVLLVVPADEDPAARGVLRI
jgi:hypothetical protein